MTGSSVAEVVALYSAALGFSQASAYRHARHRAAESSPLGVPHPEGEKPADLARHLVAVLAAQQAQLERAVEEANTKLVDSSSDRLKAVVHELAALVGMDAANIAAELDWSARAFKHIRRATLNNPDFGLGLAKAARDSNDNEFADDALDLANAAQTHLSTLTNQQPEEAA